MKDLLTITLSICVKSLKPKIRKLEKQLSSKEFTPWKDTLPGYQNLLQLLKNLIVSLFWTMPMALECLEKTAAERLIILVLLMKLM